MNKKQVWIGFILFILISITSAQDLIVEEVNECIDQQEQLDIMMKTMQTLKKIRGVRKVVTARLTPEGDGAKVKRSIGTQALDYMDPFLMLDEFFVSKPAGFPNHPHRGFETITYMLDGAFEHQDNKGHKGIIKSGDLQWMTAGRGVIHSEMPQGDGVNHGLQLWVNLAAKDKMCEPQYQELTGDQIPSAQEGKVKVKIIAGKSMGQEAKVRTRTPAYYLDFTFDPESSFDQEIPDDFSGFLYLLQGQGVFGTDDKYQEAKAGDCVVLEEQGDVVRMKNVDKENALRLVLIMGKPLKEPLARRGPFVMNTNAEIQQAFMDFYSGHFN